MSGRFEERGAGANARPHRLIALIDRFASGGVQWRVECPYEGIRPCGAVEECHGSPRDNAKWGCKPYPVPPDTSPREKPGGGYEYSDEDRAKWREFERLRSEWLDEHGGHEWHRTDECWFQIIHSHDYDPEYYLAELPDDYPINGPIEVMVGYDDDYDEPEPVFKLWKESPDADS